MIEEIIEELNLSQGDVNEINQLMHTHSNYYRLFANLSEEDYANVYVRFFKQCALEYLKRDKID